MPSGQGGITYYDLSEKRRITTLFDPGVEGWGFREVSADTIIVAGLDINGREGLRIFAVIYDSLFNEWYDDELRGSLALCTGSGRDLYFDGDYAYVAHNQSGITIAEVSIQNDYIEITELGSTDTPGGAQDVALNGDGTHAIVADYYAGISIIDITDKANPSHVASLLPDGGDRMFQVTAIGDTIYALCSNSGIFAMDVSNPVEPSLISRYDSPNPRGLFVLEDHTVFLADEELGLVVLSWRD